MNKLNEEKPHFSIGGMTDVNELGLSFSFQLPPMVKP